MTDVIHDLAPSGADAAPPPDDAVDPTPDGAAEATSDGAAEATPDRPLPRMLEAVLLVADQPLDVATLARATDRRPDEIRTALAALAAEYVEQGRGFELEEVASGWRYVTAEAYADVVERFVTDGAQARLTQAALETLAVVAYRQPISRGRISAIRGVNVEAVMRTLVTRGLVEEAGTDPSGTAVLYRTTPYFLDRLGLTSLAELPEVADHLPDLDQIEDEQEFA